MWLIMVLGVPLLIVITVFIFTSRTSIKKKMIKLAILLLSSFCLLVLVVPSLIGIKWVRTEWDDYEVPNEFNYTIKNGFLVRNERGINLNSDEPVFTIEDEYTYEIYTGDYIYEGIAEESYEGYDAIGVAVYEGNELICKWILPSIINVDSLELVSSKPITLRVQTDDFSYEYIIEVERMGTNNNDDEWYYNAINERPEREYYIPFNQGWVDRSDINE